MKLDGKWWNELGSEMALRVEDGRLSGTYESKVGDAKGRYELIGFIDVKDRRPTLGWTVTWTNDRKHAPATSTWCGEVISVQGTQEIVTTWLVVSSMPKKDLWKATLVGQDVFRRRKPTAVEYLRAKRLRGIK